MMRVTLAGFALLFGCGCSSTSSGGGGQGGTDGGNTGGSGGAGIGGSGIGGSGIGGSGIGGSGIGGSGIGGSGTGGVGTGGSGTGGSGTGGAPPNLVPTCTGTSSASAGSCYPATPCNPMTNAGCTTAGAACDIGASGFQCYDPPNDVALCGTCGEVEGFCVPGAVCIGGQCLHYCCTDTDCGSGTCYDIPLDGVTVPVKACLDAPPG